jgi:hypothetical protein
VLLVVAQKVYAYGDEERKEGRSEFQLTAANPDADERFLYYVFGKIPVSASVPGLMEQGCVILAKQDFICLPV